MIRISLTRPAAVAVFGVLLGLAPMCFMSNGVAATRGDTPEARRACTSDALRLCDRFVPDPGRVGACLKRSRRALSADCRRVIFGRAR